MEHLLLRTSSRLFRTAVSSVTSFLSWKNGAPVLSDAETTRSDLGLGSIAIQNMGVVAIAGSDIDWTAGTIFTKNPLIEDTTFTFSNIQAGKFIMVEVTGAGGYGIDDWPESVVTWFGTYPNIEDDETLRILFYAISSADVIGVVWPQYLAPLSVGAGGTGQVTAAAAFAALKQLATTSATGVVELATAAEARAHTSTTLAMTPAQSLDSLWNAGLYNFRIPVWNTSRVTYTLTGTASRTAPEGAFGSSMTVTSAGTGTAKLLVNAGNYGNWMNSNNSVRVDFSKPIRIGLKCVLKSIASAGGTNAVRIKFGETADSVAAITTGDKAIGFSIDESGNLTFVYANYAAPVVSASLAVISFSNFINTFIELHSDGLGNYSIFVNGSQVGSTVTGGPTGVTSATFKCVAALDCPTAPTADTTFAINEWLVYAKQY